MAYEYLFFIMTDWRLSSVTISLQGAIRHTIEAPAV